MSETTEPTSTSRSTTYQSKLAVHARDRYTCTGCRECFDDPSKLEAHHVVFRGQGGPNTIRNKTSLCQRCHEAIHGDRDHSPTIRCESTGDMSTKDFAWFNHFWKRQLPVLVDLAVDHRMEPKCGLAENKPYTAWHISLGDLRRVDEVLADVENLTYVPMDSPHEM